MEGMTRHSVFSVPLRGKADFSPRTMKTDRSINSLELNSPHYLTPTRNKTVFRKKILQIKKLNTERK